MVTPRALPAPDTTPEGLRAYWADCSERFRRANAALSESDALLAHWINDPRRQARWIEYRDAIAAADAAWAAYSATFVLGVPAPPQPTSDTPPF